MNSGLKERASARRQVRKINRRAAVDKEAFARKRRRIILVIAVLVFVAAEVFTLCFAKYNYDREESKKLADDMSIQLSLISSALRSGNRAIYDDALGAFSFDLRHFNENSYVKREASDFNNRLVDYHNMLINNADFLSELMDLRVAVNMLQNSTNDAKNSSIDAGKVSEIAKNYAEFREGLANIKSQELKEIKKILEDYSNEIIPLIENSAVCISVCSENILNEKRDAISRLIDDKNKELEPLDEKVSAPYNPNALIIDLGEYSKL